MADTAPSMDIEAEPDSSTWLLRIAKEPSAQVPVTDLPRVLDVTLDQAAAVVRDLLDRGMAEIWQEKASICLTPLGAGLINVVLIPDRRGRPQWQTRGSRVAEARERDASRAGEAKRKGKPQTVLACDLAATEGANVLDELEGPTAAELAEQAGIEHLYGLGLIWTGPSTAPKPGERCRGCGHRRKLEPDAVCCLCHRSGKPWLPTVAPAEPPTTPATKPRNILPSDGLEGGVGGRPRVRKTA